MLSRPGVDGSRSSGLTTASYRLQANDCEPLTRERIELQAGEYRGLGEVTSVTRLESRRGSQTKQWNSRGGATHE